MTRSECFISVVAPVHNIAHILPAFIKDITCVLDLNYTNYELILVNDGSTDQTINVVSNLLENYKCIRLINLSKTFGNDLAILSGLDCSIGDFVVTLSPLFDSCSLVPQIVESAQEGFDIIVGVSKYKHRPWWYKLGSYMFYYFSKYGLGLPVIKDSTNFLVLSRRVVNSIAQVEYDRRYLRLTSLSLGYRNNIFLYRESLCYKHLGSIHTQNIVQLASLFIEMTVKNSLRPLKLVTYLSLSASLINLLYICYVIFVYLSYRDVQKGWVTLSLQSSLMFFLISLILTVLSEYIAILLHQSKDFHTFNIISEIHSPTLIVNPDQVNVLDNESKSQEI